jgi:hypothetical protein
MECRDLHRVDVLAPNDHGQPSFPGVPGPELSQVHQHTALPRAPGYKLIIWLK